MRRYVYRELIYLMSFHKLFVKDSSLHSSLELHLWFGSPLRRYVGSPIQIQPSPNQPHSPLAVDHGQFRLDFASVRGCVRI